MKRILFVCFGNTCRSPMAEGLGKFWLKGIAEVESAGIAPSLNQAKPEAIELLKRYYQVDISSHCPRSVVEVDLKSFDLIVALDKSVASLLECQYEGLTEKLECWDVFDPFGGSLSDYEHSLGLIEKKILELKERFLNS